LGNFKFDTLLKTILTFNHTTSKDASAASVSKINHKLKKNMEGNSDYQLLKYFGLTKPGKRTQVYRL